MALAPIVYWTSGQNVLTSLPFSASSTETVCPGGRRGISEDPRRHDEVATHWRLLCSKKRPGDAVIRLVAGEGEDGGAGATAAAQSAGLCVVGDGSGDGAARPAAVLISNSMVLGGEGQDGWMRQVSWCLGRWERGAAA